MFRKVKRRNRRRLRTAYSKDPLQDDTNKYRCNVCGFICDKRKVEVLGPRPLTASEETGVKLVADGTIYKPTVIAGCPQCGTFYSRRK